MGRSKRRESRGRDRSGPQPLGPRLQDHLDECQDGHGVLHRIHRRHGEQVDRPTDDCRLPSGGINSNFRQLQVKWWDPRKFTEPIEVLVLDPCKEGTPDIERAHGSSCLEFEPTVPTKFMVGTDRGKICVSFQRNCTRLSRLKTREFCQVACFRATRSRRGRASGSGRSTTRTLAPCTHCSATPASRRLGST